MSSPACTVAACLICLQLDVRVPLTALYFDAGGCVITFAGVLYLEYTNYVKRCVDRKRVGSIKIVGRVVGEDPERGGRGVSRL